MLVCLVAVWQEGKVDLGSSSFYACVVVVGGVYVWCFSTCIKGLVRWASSLVVGGVVLFCQPPSR